MCEWKGRARYFAVRDPRGGDEVRDRVWMYEGPLERFRGIDGFVSFYTGPWECYVDGERGEFVFFWEEVGGGVNVLMFVQWSRSRGIFMGGG